MVENREVARAEHQPFGEERPCDPEVGRVPGQPTTIAVRRRSVSAPLAEAYERRPRRRSLESSLVFPHGLVTLQRFVRDPLYASFDRLDRHVIEHPEYSCADSIVGQQNAPQAFNRQNAGFFQWQVAYDGQDELLELFAPLSIAAKRRSRSGAPIERRH